MKDIKSGDFTTVFVPLSLSALRSLYGLVKFLGNYDIDLSVLLELEHYLSSVLRQVEDHKSETKDS